MSIIVWNPSVRSMLPHQKGGDGEIHIGYSEKNGEKATKNDEDNGKDVQFHMVTMLGLIKTIENENL